jgi:oligopeptide transport system ATP-binding protein
MYFPITPGLLRRHVGDVKAVDGQLRHQPGETLGLVGESGCGKSTVGRAMLRLYDITGGSDPRSTGARLAMSIAGSLRIKRPIMQMIFQDPQACLNPRMTSPRSSANRCEHQALSR